jgi:cell division inhibitor SepF
MASMWRKAMLYLGLGPDDEYDDFDVTGEHQRAEPRPAPRRSAPEVHQHDAEPSGSVRTLTPSDGVNGHGAGRVRNGDDSDRGVSVAGHADLGDGKVERGVDRNGGAVVAGREGPRRGPAQSDRPGREPRAVVRPLPSVASPKPVVISPASFNDAQEVADRFKGSAPVILNLQGVERDLARRIIDFASGLCYGLGGQMERVAHQVYLLTPSDVEVSPEERRRLRERGYEA